MKKDATVSSFRDFPFQGQFKIFKLFFADDIPAKITSLS
jgi:hypothetical protein